MPGSIRSPSTTSLAVTNPETGAARVTVRRASPVFSISARKAAGTSKSSRRLRARAARLSPLWRTSGRGDSRNFSAVARARRYSSWVAKSSGEYTERSGWPFLTAWPVKLTWRVSTHPSILVWTWRTRVSSGATRPTARIDRPPALRSTGTVWMPASRTAWWPRFTAAYPWGGPEASRPSSSAKKSSSSAASSGGAVWSIRVSFMPHTGQSPGRSERIQGCMPQV